MTRINPYAPPFKVGTRVRYHGLRWGRGPDRDHIAYVEDGEVGTVVRVELGQAAVPYLGPEFAEPVDGWSVVEFPSGATAAVTRDSVKGHHSRYESVR